jgi:hypothetical protein
MSLREDESVSSIRAVSPVMVALRWTAALLVLAVGSVLYFGAAQTADLFVFPIDPPLTAAFLGANYLAAAVVELIAARQRSWVHTRSSLAGVFIFTVLTCIFSLLNLSQFDLAGPKAWLWLGVYALFPVALLFGLQRQGNVRGVDPPPVAPLPLALKGLLALLTIVFLALGAGLILHPDVTSAAWAWELTTPNAAYLNDDATSLEPYVGCWLVGFALVVGGVIVEGDARRTFNVLAGAGTAAILNAIALYRFGDPVDWSRPAAWGYAAVIGLVAIGAAWGLLVGRPGARQRPQSDPSLAPT